MFVFRKLIVCWTIFAGGILLLITSITIVNIGGFSLNFIARFYDSSFPALSGYEDAVTLLIGIAVLSMFPYCQLCKGHIAVDFFTQNASPKFLDFIAKITNFLFFLTASFLTYSMVLGMLDAKNDSVITFVLGWKIWYFYLIGIFSSFLWVISSILTLLFPSDCGC